jgi:ATP-binding cassette subfamily B protein
MLSQHLGMPFRRDTVRRVIVSQQSRNGNLSLQHCGGVAEMIGLSAQLVNVPAVAVTRLPTPAMLNWQGSFAILYESSQKELVLAVPESGLKRLKQEIFWKFGLKMDRLYCSSLLKTPLKSGLDSTGSSLRSFATAKS